MHVMRAAAVHVNILQVCMASCSWTVLAASAAMVAVLFKGTATAVVMACTAAAAAATVVAAWSTAA